MDLGEKRRTVFIEPIEDPAEEPIATPLPDELEPEPA
jgi:hypothetical protein